jgi:hypothetical protein
MKKWLDNYGKKENANKGHSSASKEWIGEGYSNVGRNYSPAWGGQFEEGGEITQAQDGDSLLLYRNQLLKDKFYRNNPDYKTNPWAFRSDITSNKDIPNIIKEIDRGITKDRFIDYDMNSKNFGQPVTKKDMTDRFRKISNNVYSAADMAGGLADIWYNPSAPPSYFSNTIKPQKWIKYSSEKYSDDSDVPMYDPLAIKPYNIRTPQERIEWEKRYGKKTPPEPTLNKQVTHMNPISASRMSTPGLRPMQNPNIQMSGAVPQGNWNVEYLDPDSKKTETKHFISNEDAEKFYNDPANKASRKYSNASSVGRMQLGGNVYPVNYVPQAQDGIQSMVCYDRNGKVRPCGPEDKLNKWLGSPMGKAERAAEASGEKWFNPQTKKWESEQMDNFRHPMAGRYTAEGIANKFPDWMQYTPIPKAAGFIGANALGIGHELMEPNTNPSYSIWDTIREGGEDAFNNMVGAGIGSLPFVSDATKTKWLQSLSDNNMLPDGIGKVDPKRNNGKPNLYKHAMGGSIPGSVGFTYARTNSPAPSNGPYAKKTKASAQRGKKVSETPIDLSTNSIYAEPINESLQYTKDWMNSPMYKKMLMESVGGDQKKYDKINNARLNSLNEGNVTFSEMPMSPNWSASTFTNVKKGKSRIAFNPNAVETDLPHDSIHELSHVTDRGGIDIPTSDMSKMHKYAIRNIKESPVYQSAKDLHTLRDLYSFTNYVKSPTETRARIHDIRKSMLDQGVYDPFTQSVDKDILSKYKRRELSEEDKKQGATVGFDPLQQLRMVYTDDEIIDLMNSVSKNDDSEMTPIAQNGQEMSFYQHGLDWKPKTISKNGGWLDKYNEGGVIKDDRGQWDHPGEITEIGSNRITMQGVPYPVLGISDTGDQQMMFPGEEYKFKGKKVTEFPMAQNGYTTDPNDYSRWQDSVSNYNASMAHLAASRKNIKKNIDDFSVLSKEGIASAIGNLFDSDVRKIRPKYSEVDIPKEHWYRSDSEVEMPSRIIYVGDQDFYGGYEIPGIKGNMYTRLNDVVNSDWYNSHEYASLYSDTVPIYPPPVRKNLQLVNAQKKIEKPKPTPPPPSLKRKPVKMETIKSKSSTSTPGIKTMSGTPVKEPPIPKRGEYRVSYYNPDIKDWSEQAFETEKESDKFADEMSKRGYGSGAGNVTQTRKVSRKENGGWLSQYK